MRGGFRLFQNTLPRQCILLRSSVHSTLSLSLHYKVRHIGIDTPCPRQRIRTHSAMGIHYSKWILTTALSLFIHYHAFVVNPTKFAVEV